MLSHHDRQIILATLRALAEKDVHLNYGTEDGYEAYTLPSLARVFEDGGAALLSLAIEKQIEGAPIYALAEDLRKRADVHFDMRDAASEDSRRELRARGRLDGKGLAYKDAAALVEAALNGGE